MANDFSRGRRVGEQIRRELASLIQNEVKDPRVGLITITGVEVSRDMAYAKIYVSAFKEAEQMDESLRALNRAAGFLRRELGRRLTIRVTPELKFLHDASIENGARLSRLIDEAVGKENPDTTPDSKE